MNRKLKINILQIEKEHNHHQESHEYKKNDGKEEDQEVESEQQYIQQQEQQGSHARDNQDISEELKNSNYQTYERIQTFGSHQFYPQQIIDSLNKAHFNDQDIKQRKISFLLSETPIELDDDPRKRKASHKAIDQSNIDDEISRIVRKVMNKEKAGKLLRQNGYEKEVQRIKKIDKINKQLLNENAQLIEQINGLEKKMNSINNKVPLKKHSKKADTSGIVSQDENLMNSLKKYRDKIAKALDLNGRLSSRLIVEKSKSNIASNTQRSIINKISAHTEDMGVISTIRSHSLREDKYERKQKKSPMKINSEQHVYCEKCCKQIKFVDQYGGSSNKRDIMSPVLQVKNYQINNSLKSDLPSEFQLQSRKIYASACCQADIDEENYKQQMFVYEKQEQELQLIVEKNNKIIQEYEQSLYKMVELD